MNIFFTGAKIGNIYRNSKGTLLSLHTSHPAENILVRKTTHFPERMALGKEVGPENHPFSRTDGAEAGRLFGKPLKNPDGIDNDKKFN